MMKKLQKILLLLFKSKYIWIPLLAVSIVLQLIGIATLIGIHYYQAIPKDGLFGAWQYSYELSEKAALDTWKKDTIAYNMSKSCDTVESGCKIFGEFRSRVTIEKDVNGRESIGSKPSVNGKTVGSLYINGKIYDAELDSQTGDILYKSNRSYERPNWRWYHWMGFRSPEIVSVIQMFDPSFGKSK